MGDALAALGLQTWISSLHCRIRHTTISSARGRSSVLPSRNYNPRGISFLRMVKQHKCSVERGRTNRQGPSNSVYNRSITLHFDVGRNGVQLQQIWRTIGGCSEEFFTKDLVSRDPSRPNASDYGRQPATNTSSTVSLGPRQRIIQEAAPCLFTLIVNQINHGGSHKTI